MTGLLMGVEQFVEWELAGETELLVEKNKIILKYILQTFM
jgi:hypothetical protein